MTNTTKILIAVLLIIVVVGSGAFAFFMYQRMKANAMKKPATNYVIEESKTTQPTPAEAGPTVPPELNEPVAEDATGLDKEIMILDKTINASDSTTVTQNDIKNVNK